MKLDIKKLENQKNSINSDIIKIHNELEKVNFIIIKKKSLINYDLYIIYYI
jgi:hypothetical protein